MLRQQVGIQLQRPISERFTAASTPPRYRTHLGHLDGLFLYRSCNHPGYPVGCIVVQGIELLYTGNIAEWLRGRRPRGRPDIPRSLGATVCPGRLPVDREAISSQYRMILDVKCIELRGWLWQIKRTVAPANRLVEIFPTGASMPRTYNTLSIHLPSGTELVLPHCYSVQRPPLDS